MPSFAGPDPEVYNVRLSRCREELDVTSFGSSRRERVAGYGYTTAEVHLGLDNRQVKVMIPFSSEVPEEEVEEHARRAAIAHWNREYNPLARNARWIERNVPEAVPLYVADHQSRPWGYEVVVEDWRVREDGSVMFCTNWREQ